MFQWEVGRLLACYDFPALRLSRRALETPAQSRAPLPSCVCGPRRPRKLP